MAAAAESLGALSPGIQVELQGGLTIIGFACWMGEGMLLSTCSLRCYCFYIACIKVRLLSIISTYKKAYVLFLYIFLASQLLGLFHTSRDAEELGISLHKHLVSLPRPKGRDAVWTLNYVKYLRSTTVFSYVGPYCSAKWWEQHPNDSHDLLFERSSDEPGGDAHRSFFRFRKVSYE